MVRSRLRIPLILLLSLSALSAAADYCGGLINVEIVSNVGTKYKLGRGAKTILREEGSQEVFEGVFLGRTINLDRSTKGYVFYEAKKERVHIFESTKIRIEALNEDGTGVAQGSVAPAVLSRNQQGGTCAAYTLFNCFRQLDAMGVGTQGSLPKVMADEGTRLDFLGSLINKLYIEQTNGTALNDVIRSTAESMSFRIQETTGESLPQNIVKNLEMGWPVLLRFDCGPTMCEMPYEILSHGDNTKLSKSLWQPNTKSSGSAGGHAVLLLGIFEAEGKRAIFVSDPNFQAPRIWPLSNLDRWSTSKMRAWTVWEQR